MKATFIFALLIAAAFTAGVDEWRKRSVYQILTDRFYRSSGDTSPCMDLSRYCHGDFKGITAKLDYIKGMGFDAIWISSPLDNLEGHEEADGYHGYWHKNWEKINHHFGTEEDLHELVKTYQSNGIYVMVDVVPNHVAPVGHDYSGIYPFN